MPVSVPQHFVFMLVPDFTHIAFSCALEPLRIANLVSGESLYRWSPSSHNGCTETCSNGTVTLVDHDFQSVANSDYLFVLTGIHVARHGTPALCKAVQRASRHTRVLGGLCSGMRVLVRASC